MRAKKRTTVTRTHVNGGRENACEKDMRGHVNVDQGRGRGKSFAGSAVKVQREYGDQFRAVEFS